MTALAAPFTVREFHRVGELRAAAGAWDDLWRRAESAAPLTRAELLAQWLDEFAPMATWRCLAVEEAGQLVAALPLVGRRVTRLVELGTVPSNPWCVCGDLLVDPEADVPAVMDALVNAVNRRPWPLLWLTPIPLAAARWQAFAAALKRAEMPFATQTNYSIGEIQIVRDWPAYEASWTSKHRRQMRKVLRLARRDGSLELKVYDRFQGDELEQALRHGFAIENRSWKGQSGTSVLRTPGMFDLYHCQARQLAEWGQLQLAFLEHAGREIAFEYGFCAKRTYFSAKVGYDSAFAAYCPGQLLRLLLLKRFHDEAEVARFDFWGPLSQATSQWADSAYPVGRLVVSRRRLAAKLSFQAFRLLQLCGHPLRRTPRNDDPAVAPRAKPATIRPSRATGKPARVPKAG